MPPPEKIVKKFPREGDLQLFRLEKLYELPCVPFKAQKTSKPVVAQGGDRSKWRCNGCHGLLVSKKG